MADEVTAVEVAESAPVEQVSDSPGEQVLVDSNLEAWTDKQRDTWLLTGKTPAGKGERSAPPEETGATEPEAAAESVPAQPGQDVAKPQARPNAETRKKQLGAEIQQLLEQRRQLRTELEAKPSVTPQPASQPAPQTPAEGRPVRPKIDQYESYDEYEIALDAYEESLADYKADQRIMREKTEYQRQQEAQAVLKRNQEIRQNWDKRVADTRKRHPDFEEMVQSSDVPINPIMDGLILDSEIGPEIVYHLAQHPDDARRIAGLNAFATARELTKIEIALQSGITTTPAKSNVTGAKPPPTQLGGANTAPADEVSAAVASGDFRRYMATANAREMKRT